MLPQRRNDYPAPLNALIDYVADHPMSLPGRLAALRLGIPRRRQDPGISRPGKGYPRILVAPVNYSDQSTQWARALRDALPDASTATMAVDVPGGFSFASDLVVPVAIYQNSRQWQTRQREAIRMFSHVLVEAEEPLLGRLMARSIRREFVWMREAGIDVAFISHGTDLRVPSYHAAREKWSPYLDPEFYSRRLERTTRANIAFLRESGRPLFVSTPDLLHELPEARWCPVVVDPGRWETVEDTAQRNLDESRPIRVIHAPSVSLIKGTQLIEPLLLSLHEEGVIDYRAVRGVPSIDMPAVYGNSDVVLDQFRLGSYGVAACEAMAAGKLVIGHVSSQVRDRVKADSGCELPILQATPDTLEAALRNVAANRELIAEAGTAGQHFVRHWHDGAQSARTLIDAWITPGSVSALSAEQKDR